LFIEANWGPKQRAGKIKKKGLEPNDQDPNDDIGNYNKDES